MEGCRKSLEWLHLHWQRKVWSLSYFKLYCLYSPWFRHVFPRQSIPSRSIILCMHSLWIMGCCTDKCEDITNVAVWSPGVKSSSDAAVPLSELERVLDSEVNSLIPLITFRCIHTITFSNNIHNHVSIWSTYTGPQLIVWSVVPSFKHRRSILHHAL